MKCLKRSCLASAFFLTLHCAPALSQETPALGDTHFYFGLSAMVMQHVTFESDDAGLHVGVGGYKHVRRDWYLGAELGTGSSLAFLGSESDITTLEVNGKRVFAIGNTLRFGLGAGLSYDHVTYDERTLFGSADDVTIDDWVLGAQVLANAQAKLGRLIFGAHLAYMLTADVDGVQEAEGLEEGWDYSNVRVGLHLGFLLH